MQRKKGWERHAVACLDEHWAISSAVCFFAVYVEPRVDYRVNIFQLNSKDHVFGK